ncbi:MAG: hypothetical protein RLZZ603_175 [Actinomycetota bacterium]
MIDHDHDPAKLANFRELGGLPVAGGVLRHGQLYRADDLATIDALEAQRVTDSGITLILDLRSLDEAERTGRGPLEHTEVDYVNLPLLGQASAPHQIMAEAAETGFTPEVMGIWYHRLLADAAPLVIEALDRIAKAEGPVVFHCAAGKDRTGLVAACLLAALGASNEVIVEDYAKTQAAMPAIISRITASQPNVDFAQLQDAGSMLRADADSMRTFLALSSQPSGTLADTIADLGLSQETVAELRRKYVLAEAK